MKSTPTPAFSSPGLQQAVGEVRPLLEGADDARNKVSNDIKALEAYLQRLDLNTSFRFSLGKYFIPEGDGQSVAAALEYGGNASGGIGEEALAWGPDSSGKFRLLHEVSEWEGSVEVDVPGGPFFWDESTLRTEAKPLIETKFEVRKRMHSHLPSFVKALGKDLAVEPVSIDPKSDIEDLPF